MTAPDAPLVPDAPPALDDETAARLAAEHFGVTASARSLGSHQDRNVLLTPVDGSPRMLLKIANPASRVVELEAQSQAAEHIRASGGIRVPLARRAPDGSTVRRMAVAGVEVSARLLDFLEGDTLSGDRYLRPDTVRTLGRLAAETDAALADFAHPGVDRVQQWDLRHAAAALRVMLPSVADQDLRALLTDAAADAQRRLDAVAAHLPMQPIHGDLTDDNVVAGPDGAPDGLIDLGDLTRSWTVAEIVITFSALLHHDGLTLPAALEAVRAYAEVRPLTDAEVAAFWPLLVLRGATLVASAHHVIASDPGNAYAAGNLDGERRILFQALSVPIEVGTALVAAATGRRVAPLTLDAPRRLIADSRPTHVLDLSTSSPALDEGRWLDADIEGGLAAEALSEGAGLVLTRFGESRLTRSDAPSTAEPVNTALGVSITVAEPLDLHAPWDGEARIDDDSITLLGGPVELRIRGIVPTSASGPVTAGALLARVTGTAWVQAGVLAPPFVARSLLAAWRHVTADPTALIADVPVAPEPLDADDLLRRRNAVFATVQEHYFAEPPVMVRGWREYLVDQHGRVYLDTLNNVTAVGHAHPRVIAASSAQWRMLNTNSRFHYPAVVEYAERLASLLPEPLDTVFLVNSGSEAVDLSLRLAQAATGRRDVVAMREAYHGWTFLSDAVSTSVADNPDALHTRPDWVHTVEMPNPFRGRYRGGDVGRYAEDAAAEIARLAAAGAAPAAFIAEAVFGNAGGIPLPAGYLSHVYDAVHAAGGLTVADEVQVGLGRLGTTFWGFEQQGVVPDIVAVAKAAGNGHPLGAVVTTRAIADAYRAGGYFFSSAGGSPVSSAVGLAVLDVIRDERLQENAAEVGAYLIDRLTALGARYPILGTVHGSGLYLGPEFVSDRETWAPATRETSAICARLRERGILAQPTGDHQNVLKIKPPMCFSRASADTFVDQLAHVLECGW
ncbi:MAG: aminotransferase [Microbacterium sp.]|uniref:aminotransferase n=1 Tax=Microbacterium sp. TaxID=51671 RepID=UPI00261665EC|nr:aminotransferase [Microbacterium sp.]MCX6501672.1 aminotransferase [Microbacterium sp.]